MGTWNSLVCSGDAALAYGSSPEPEEEMTGDWGQRGTQTRRRGPHPNCPSWRSHLLYSRVMTVLLCPHTKRMDATWRWGYFVKKGQSFCTQTPALKPKLHINTCPLQASQSMDWEHSSEKKNRWISSLPVFKSPKSPSGAYLDSTSISPKATLSQVHPLQRLSSALSRVPFPKLLREGPCRGEKAHFPRSLWS